MTSRGAFVASSRSGEIVWEDFEEKAKKVWTAKKKKNSSIPIQVTLFKRIF